MGYSSVILETKLDGTIDEVLGTCSHFKADGRLGYEKADYACMSHYISEKHIRPYIIGYRLFKNGQRVRDFIFKA